MRTVENLFNDYAAYHRTPGNKAFHRIGIPLIMLTLIGMLVRVAFVVAGTRLDAAMILIAVATIYYLVIEWRLALAMLAVSVGFYFLGAAMPFWLNVALFVLGWIFQFIGHSVYEHRQPAFFRNFLHLLVGPLWILNDLLPVVRTTRTT
ncbi:MAG: DUF962 domain-containing protein [Acidobacteria bacterium]|nr:DUF962 domain-containing protein [Acidobacteriota bacterium]MBV9475629.1 DUF962 domain-containing protein [Acidobacteriota bacterium]